MTKQEITAWFIVLIIIIIAIYDSFAMIIWGEPATISQVIRNWAKQFPLLKPLILSGMLTFFWHLFLR